MRNFIFWENKWGCWDCMELTGEFKEEAKYKDFTYPFRRDYATIESKVLNVERRRMYQINTGFIHTDKEVLALSEMLASDHICLYRNNEIQTVKSTTRKLVVEDPSSVLKSFKLTFENVLI